MPQNLGASGARNELGKSGLKHFGGTLYEEFLPQLVGDKGRAVYLEMSQNSPVIGAMLFAVESLLRSVEWEIDPVSQDSADVEAAEFLEECKEDMSHTWEDFISEILSHLIYGWSYFEVVMKKRDGEKKGGVNLNSGKSKPASSKFDDGRIGWRKFALRSQDTLYRWEIDPQGGIMGMWQYPVPSTPTFQRGAGGGFETVFIPISKALLFRTTSTKNSPEGRSILRSAYRPWYYSKRIEEIEAVGMDRDLVGMPVGKIPIELLSKDATADQKATLAYITEVITKTKRDEQEGIIWPKVIDPDTGSDLFEIELLTSGGRRTFDTGAVIQRYMQQQAMTIMADFILLGHESVGSFALSSDKTELFAVALGAWLDGIEEILNRHAVPSLFDLNNFDIEEYPKFRHGDIEKPDIQMIGGYIQSLASSGAQLFPDIELENRLRGYADLPEVDEEERDRMMMESSAGSFFGGDGASVPQSSPTAGRPTPGSPSVSMPPGGPAEKQPDDIAKKAPATLRPQYYDGTRWKTIHGRRRFLKELRDKVDA